MIIKAESRSSRKLEALPLTDLQKLKSLVIKLSQGEGKRKTFVRTMGEP